MYTHTHTHTNTTQHLRAHKLTVTAQQTDYPVLTDAGVLRSSDKHIETSEAIQDAATLLVGLCTKL